MSHEQAIDEIEKALRERYHVPTLKGLGVLPGAVEVARGGDYGPLRAALEGREMYRWHGAIDAALAELDSPEIEADEASEIEGKVEERPEGADEGRQDGTFLPDEEERKPTRRR